MIPQKKMYINDEVLNVGQHSTKCTFALLHSL